MQAVIKAVYAKVLATLTGTFPAWTPPDGSVQYPVSYFHGIAPNGSPYPRLIGQVVGGGRSEAKYGGGMAFEPVSFHFTAYSNVDDVTVLADIEAVMGVFDDLILTLASGTMINTVRTGQPIPMLDIGEDKDGNDVWRADVTYNWTISH